MKPHHALGVAALAMALVIAFQPTSHKGPPNLYPTIKGVTNPLVTQANLNETICKAGWTATIRPPASYTTGLKIQQLASSMTSEADPTLYEEDHFISLELGGNPTDPDNLWPEKYDAVSLNGRTVGARQKDQVEDFLHREVCAGKLTLKQAQDAITGDWYALYTADTGSASDTDD